MRPASLFAVATGAVALVIGFTVVTTRAHTPTITAECNGLHVELDRYDGSHGAANTLTVIVDNRPPVIANFATTYHNTFQWSTTAPHDWSAHVTSIAADGGGTWTGRQESCGTAEETSTTTQSTSPPPPTAPNSTTSMPSSTVVPSASSAPTATGPATSTSSVAPADSSSTTSPAPAPPSNAPRISRTSPRRSPASELPATGGPSPHDLLWAIVVVAIGVALILIGRRPRRRT